jgi:hypothetical protein
VRQFVVPSQRASGFALLPISEELRSLAHSEVGALGRPA